MTCKRHQHEFSGLYWHFGEYGPQDVHVHSCYAQQWTGPISDDPCERVLIGNGRDCRAGPHVRHTLGTDLGTVMFKLGKTVKPARLDPQEKFEVELDPGQMGATMSALRAYIRQAQKSKRNLIGKYGDEADLGPVEGRLGAAQGAMRKFKETGFGE